MSQEGSGRQRGIGASRALPGGRPRLSPTPGRSAVTRRVQYQAPDAGTGWPSVPDGHPSPEPVILISEPKFGATRLVPGSRRRCGCNGLYAGFRVPPGGPSSRGEKRGFSKARDSSVRALRSLVTVIFWGEAPS